MESTYRVKEVLNLKGFTRKDLHYLHRKGVVEPVGFETKGEYKIYDEKGLDKLIRISILRGIGMKKTAAKSLEVAPIENTQTVTNAINQPKSEDITEGNKPYIPFIPVEPESEIKPKIGHYEREWVVDKKAYTETVYDYNRVDTVALDALMPVQIIMPYMTMDLI